jgi:hypothetical protein
MDDDENCSTVLMVGEHGVYEIIFERNRRIKEQALILVDLLIRGARGRLDGSDRVELGEGMLLVRRVPELV